jgi:palmitoyltransferase
MLRNVNFLRLFGNLFVLFNVAYMVYMYYIFIYVNVLLAQEKDSGVMAFLVIFHIVFGLMLFSFLQVIASDPGKVPLYWGFFLDDPDHKRRRYCLICHIFKPERCHHCSACNRCVLNMDHHCPWLNNCVGFYNRKFFLLLIFYVIVCKGILALYFIPTVFDNIVELYQYGLETPFFPTVLTLLSYVLNGILLTIMSFFFSFHVKLVISNMTTIEHMEKKRNNEVTNYDMGLYYNFVQIFGKNPYLWMIPVFMRSGKPIGDGVVWPQKPSKAQSYDAPDASIREPATESKSNAGVEMSTRTGGGASHFDNSIADRNIGITNGMNYPNATIPLNNTQTNFSNMTTPTPVVQQRLNLDPMNGTSQRIIAENSMQPRPLETSTKGNPNIMANYMSFSNTQPLYEKFVDH